MKKLKLNSLSTQSLERRELDAVKGGTSCGCSCYHANNNGSSIANNRNANYKDDLVSKEGCNQHYAIDGSVGICLDCNETLMPVQSSISSAN